MKRLTTPIGEILDSLLEAAAMDETGDYLTRGRSPCELDDGQSSPKHQVVTDDWPSYFLIT